MWYKLKRTKTKSLMSVLLTVFLILTLPAVPVLAATAAGNASGTAGYNYILVNLSQGKFSAAESDVTTAGNWQLTGLGSRSINSITRQNDTSVMLRLTGNITADDDITLQALPAVFDGGTEPFAGPIAVTVHVPVPATGTATATTGGRDISVALTYGSFGSKAPVENKSFWTLSGVSAAGNPIVSVTRIDSTHATVTLTKNIQAGDAYSITGSQSVFVNIAVAPFAAPLTVTITSAAPVNECSIDGKEYATLDAALAVAPVGGTTTITLLKDIQRTGNLLVRNRTILFDLGNFNLSVNNPASGAAVDVEDGHVSYAGSGSFTAAGLEGGVSVRANAGQTASAVVTSATALVVGTHAAVAVDVFGENATVTMNGDVTVSGKNGIGVRADNGGSATVTGSVSATGEEATGVRVSDEGSATVNGGITVKGNNSEGVYAESGGSVTVNRDITVTGFESCGADAHQLGGSAAVGGSITANGEGACGIEVYDFGQVTVTHDVSVTGHGGTGVSSHKGEGAGGTVAVSGNVTAAGGANTGAAASYGGEITIDGILSATGTYILLENNIILDANDNDETTTKAGYLTYSNTVSAGRVTSVWVGNGNVPGPTVLAPTVVTDTVSGVTTSGALLSGNVTSDGGAAVTERGFVYAVSANPTTATGITVTTGAGAGFFTAPLTGLAPGTAYHVRAYAVNSAGTGYGADVSFTTVSLPGPPPSSPSEPSYSLPTVVTNAVSGITASGATLSGSVTSDGGAAVTERGFVYGAAANPAIGGAGIAKATAGNGTGGFTTALTGLAAGATYHVRAYAVNSRGTAYGADVSFTTIVLLDEELIPEAGAIGYLDASGIDLSNPYGNVVLYTDLAKGKHILGLGIVVGSGMKYVSRGPGGYEIIYNAKPFDDIAGHWARNDIDFSSARLLFHGVTPRLFSPDTAMTRGMFAAVLGRMYGVDPALYTGSSFDDVPSGAYYAPYVKWARDNKIILGVSESLFEPERPVTRQEMAVLMHRFMKYLKLELPAGGGTGFDDEERIGSWAKESVLSLQETGIFGGIPGNRFDPGISSTRAEVAAVFRRLIEYIVK